MANEQSETTPATKYDQLEAGIASLERDLKTGPRDTYAAQMVLAAARGILAYANHLEERIGKLEVANVR
jgi:outer membrane murein-binding lipoprotein Lpp